MRFLSYLLVSYFFIFVVASLKLYSPHLHTHKFGKKAQIGADLVLSALAICAKSGASVCNLFRALDKKTKALEENKQNEEVTDFTLSRIEAFKTDLKAVLCVVAEKNGEI
ncbi:hypothetical protein K502DRAFT_352492 [Neoconidiobolus thromboides FSU 785]|nr:hypothetical protein K502DRAFT_352492 [Neoconidiobolus thromboides FSU 785]